MKKTENIQATATTTEITATETATNTSSATTETITETTTNKEVGFRSMLENHYKTGLLIPLSKEEFVAQGMQAVNYTNWCKDCKTLLVALGDYYAQCRNNEASEKAFMPKNVYEAYKKILSYLLLGESETKLKVGKNDLNVLLAKCVTTSAKKEETGDRTFRRELERFICSRLSDEKILTRSEYEKQKEQARKEKAEQRKKDKSKKEQKSETVTETKSNTETVTESTSVEEVKAA